jgi:hypothetical protein
MGLKATAEGVFLGTEIRPWEMNGQKGETLQASILQGMDSTRLSCDKSVSEKDFPPANTVVQLDLDMFRDGGSYKPKVIAVRKKN